MRILVYEYLTGGGLWHEPPGAAGCPALLAEGQAMRQALVDDLLAWEGRPCPADAAESAPRGASDQYQQQVHLIGFQDTRIADLRLPESDAAGVELVRIDSGRAERQELAAWAARADWTLLIAPETGGRLLERARLVEQQGGTLASPGSSLIALATDKQATVLHLQTHGVPVPLGTVVLRDDPLPSRFPYPAVLKPLDGCGSMGITHVLSSQQAVDWSLSDAKRWRLESFCAGLPISVSALCGPAGYLLLPPCRQDIAGRSRPQYRGGRLPLRRECAARALQLAHRTLAALPPARGYVGIDMVLGADGSGRKDVVLEVNPRLTTSYVGLRHAVRTNLAAAMMRIAGGQTADDPLLFTGRRIQFTMEGHVDIREQGDQR
jgi:predicted ATP-grasp superfamily ATP-dependent carboligase